MFLQSSPDAPTLINQRNINQTNSLKFSNRWQIRQLSYLVLLIF
ncbi:hypothetical protein FDUTEX481_06078 [Tolypothrix sp. PCC 7601]|nr:hypothetical protein FDUTEX481_06078 [Tolypothrix sp. PCC 7601]